MRLLLPAGGTAFYSLPLWPLIPHILPEQPWRQQDRRHRCGGFGASLLLLCNMHTAIQCEARMYQQAHGYLGDESLHDYDLRLAVA